VLDKFPVLPDKFQEIPNQFIAGQINYLTPYFLLIDKYSAVRREAVQSLDKKYPDWRTSPEAAELVPDFIAGLKSTSDDTRKGAISALEEVGDARAQVPLINALKDTKISTREAALKSLEKKYQDWGSRDEAGKLVPFFINELKSKSSKHRKHAARVLAAVKDPRCVPALADKNVSIRERAVKALGNKNDDRVIEPLIAALKDEFSSVTKAAIDALGERKDPRAVMPLVDFLKRSEPHHKRYVINVRASAFQALGKMDDLLIVDPMLELFKEGDLGLRIGVENRLENIKDPRAADILIGYLKSEHIEIRAIVRRILGKLKNERAVEPLIELLKSPDKRERERTAAALKSITGKDYGVKYKKWKKWWNKNKK
jgi:HEAT repeat protein